MDSKLSLNFRSHTGKSASDVYNDILLNTKQREIRIWTLAPDARHDILCGNLSVESLDYDDLHYTELSYTWSGSITEDTIIIINRAARPLADNLRSALEHFRELSRQELYGLMRYSSINTIWKRKLFK